MSPGPTKQFDTQDALDSAMDLFWEEGYHGTSLSMLMSKMGIGKKSLYDTFGNKRALFLKALDRYAAKSLEGVKEILAHPGDALASLRNLFGHFQGEQCKGCFYGTNMACFGVEDDEEIAERFCHHLKNFEAAIADHLAKAKVEGGLNPKVQPEAAAAMLNCLSQGTALTARVSRCSKWRMKAFDTAFELLRA